uniref:palmitoyl-protein hydrolase n=1 Tax=Trichuris muris TaxID=70415 RepID=A0A5S6QAB6_TRIMR
MAAPAVIKATGRHTATVIFMHGLGDSGFGWISMFQAIKAPHVKYICPHAPSIPVTLNGGMVMPSWFDILGLSVNSPEDENGIKQASKIVHGWVDDEIRSGIPSNRIVLGGFSQGGALALYSAFTYKEPLAGVVALSCWLPLHTAFSKEAMKTHASLPILQCHGSADLLVSPQVASTTAGILSTLCSNHAIKWFPQMGHSACDEELTCVKAFLERTLPSV